MSKTDIKIVLINGSVRPGNNTMKALRVAEESLLDSGYTCELIDPAVFELPLPGTKTVTQHDVDRLIESVQSCTGVVLATPEYHGSFSSVMKLIIDNLGFPSALKGKPVALLGVASGEIGAIKALEHLRSVCSHVGAIVLPGPVSVASAAKQFDTSGNVIDDKIAGRIHKLARNLAAYIEDHVCPGIALEKMVREQN